MKEILSVIKQIFEYLWKTKKWWLVPAALFLVIVGLLILLSSATSVPVFVYPLV